MAQAAPFERLRAPPTIGGINRVEEIERAIQELSHDEFAEIVRRLNELEQERWDAELDRDAASGKLDFLIDKAEDDRKHGRLKDWRC